MRQYALLDLHKKSISCIQSLNHTVSTHSRNNTMASFIGKFLMYKPTRRAFAVSSGSWTGQAANKVRPCLVIGVDTNGKVALAPLTSAHLDPTTGSYQAKQGVRSFFDVVRQSANGHLIVDHGPLESHSPHQQTDNCRPAEYLPYLALSYRRQRQGDCSATSRSQAVICVGSG